MLQIKPEIPENPQLGWIGLGNMGRGMAKNLVEKASLSHPLLIFNRTVSKAETLAEKLGGDAKVKVASSMIDLVTKSDIILYCLGEDDSVMSQTQEILDSKIELKGKLFVDCSTIHPDTTFRENELLTGSAASFVACPVFGAPAMAESGQLVCVLAGPSEAIAHVLPYCSGVMGRANINLSDSDSGDVAPSKALQLKLIGNTFILSMVETLSEGHTLAEKSGLGVDQMHKFVEMMFPGPYAAYSTRMLSGDYHKRDEPLFAVDLARKDARHAKKLAEDAGMRMRNVELADEYLVGVKEHMGERGDIASIYGAKRKEAGLKFENGG